MPSDEKQQCIQIKACYGLEHLHFYLGRDKKFHCTYISDSTNFDFENKDEIAFLMNMLTCSLGYIYFDDAGEICKGIDELKTKYLIFKLAGLT